MGQIDLGSSTFKEKLRTLGRGRPDLVPGGRISGRLWSFLVLGGQFYCRVVGSTVEWPDVSLDGWILRRPVTFGLLLLFFGD